MITVPDGYSSKLGLYDTQNAIGKIKNVFFNALCENLNLKRATAPLFVQSNTGINDDLNGVERPVTFPIKDMQEQKAEIRCAAVLPVGFARYYRARNLRC